MIVLPIRTVSTVLSAMSSGAHRAGNHEVCKLCSKTNPKMKTPGKMKEHTQHNVVYEWLRQNKPTIKESEYNCLPCVKQIKQYHDKPNFIPRWIPKSSMQKKCSIERCQAELHTHTTLASVEQIEMILNERVNTFTISSSSQSVALCREHYAQVYTHLHPATPCDSCGVKPKKGEAFKRHCPSPAVVNGYLSHISTETSSLTASSVICTSCYKYFQTIVKQLNQKLVSTPTSNPSTNNIDTILTTILQSLKCKGQTIENGKLEIVWEVLENIQKAKASLDFVLTGCKCKTGCTTRICSCRKKELECAPSYSCQFCKNMNTPTHVFSF